MASRGDFYHARSTHIIPYGIPADRTGSQARKTNMPRITDIMPALEALGAAYGQTIYLSRMDDSRWWVALDNLTPAHVTVRYEIPPYAGRYRIAPNPVLYPIARNMLENLRAAVIQRALANP